MTDQPLPTRAAAPSVPADRAATLIDGLTRQRDLYQQLKALSDQQGRLIADGDAEPLLAVLSQRQALVDQLAQLNDELAPFRAEWPDASPRISDDERQRVNALLAEVEQLLEAIIAQDDGHRRALESAKQEVGQQLQRTHTAGKALHAYQPAGATSEPARFTDRQG